MNKKPLGEVASFDFLKCFKIQRILPVPECFLVSLEFVHTFLAVDEKHGRTLGSGRTL